MRPSLGVPGSSVLTLQQATFLQPFFTVPGRGTPVLGASQPHAHFGGDLTTSARNQANIRAIFE
eukprot:scaffold82069_cov18-Tisochrysis_lutea.AAC.1